MSDFYANAAQVLALVVLALVWESKYFDNLREKTFKSGWWRWKLWKVQLYSAIVAVAVIVDVGLCLAVLGGWLTNSTVLRVIVGAGLILALGSLLFRMISHIMGWDKQVASQKDPSDLS